MHAQIVFFNPPPSATDVALSPLKLITRLMSGDKPAAAPLAGSKDSVLLSASSPGAAALFGPLDDVVMGGVSSSGLRLAQGAGETGGDALLFSGVVSTSNNGGFASVRNRDYDPPRDASGTAGVELRVKGDGQRYKLFVRTAPGWDALAYGASFDTEAGVWTSIKLDWSSFRPIFRARTISGAPPLELKSIRSLQLMLSKFEYDNVRRAHIHGSRASDAPGTPSDSEPALQRRRAVRAAH